MSMPYQTKQPERSEVEAMDGPVALEFGTDWCGYCRGAAAAIREAMLEVPATRHIKVEDGPGRPLGRSFRVKLWPTVVVLMNGHEVARVVRPADADEVRRALDLTRL